MGVPCQHKKNATRAHAVSGGGSRSAPSADYTLHIARELWGVDCNESVHTNTTNSEEGRNVLEQSVRKPVIGRRTDAESTRTDLSVVVPHVMSRVPPTCCRTKRWLGEPWNLR
jgi:hypothetical protein